MLQALSIFGFNPIQNKTARRPSRSVSMLHDQRCVKQNMI